MRNTACMVLLVLLALLTGCDWFKPVDHDQGWIEPTSVDFPVYVGHFADYEHTDAVGNHLGRVTYGENGNDKDWTVFDYDASNKSVPSLRGLIIPRDTKDQYYICVKAIDAQTNAHPPADILLNGSPTGFTTPHTFTHTGSYDPALVSQYTVEHWNYYFPVGPEVVFDAETNTYNYTFIGFPDYIPPPWGSFVATVTEQADVRLTWVTWSETAMSGFRIHRADNIDIASAQDITPELIPATNTGEMQTYSFTDAGVQLGSTYYYWLEEVDLEDNSTFLGPVSAKILPAVNAVSYAYPNPCQDRFHLWIDVKLGSSATVLLLDSEHNIRKTHQLEGGSRFLQVDVDNLEQGFYRVFIWFSNQQYAYGDVLIQD